MNSQFAGTLSKTTFHLFLFLGVLTTVWRQMGGDVYPFSYVAIHSVLIYLIVSAVLQTVMGLFQPRRNFIGIALAILYIASVALYFFLPQLIYVAVFTSSTGEPASPVVDWLPIITAVTGLVSALSAAVSQITLRKTALAEVEVEKQKLELEREKLELEKSKRTKPKRKAR
ncbi:MAG: hypothetical protein HYZ23_07420 [Chloroflexi bacterium]|nr:hypothetical protein [Chloroflexota bacterium]